MEDIDFLKLYSPFVIILFILIIWETVWKGVALWKAGRNNDLTWFLIVFIINSLGILPIIYIFIVLKNKDIDKEKFERDN